MGFFSSWFGSGDRFTTGGKSKNNGGSHHGVRQNGSGQKAGYVTYDKSTGKGTGVTSNREYAGPDNKR